jgi:hypothetical protein
MALINQTPPAKTRRAFKKGLAEMIELGRAPTDLPRGDYPQQIYALGLDDIVVRKNLEDVKPVAWEFLMGRATGPAIAVAVRHPHTGQEPKVTSLMRGPLIAQAIQATHMVQKLRQVQRRNYELRRLRIPALSIGAFWLKSLDGGDDFVVPYQTVADELEPRTAYPMDEFLTIIRPMARKLEADKSLRPPR